MSQRKARTRPWRRVVLALAASVAASTTSASCSSSPTEVNAAADGVRRVDVEVRLGRVLSGPTQIRLERGQQVVMTVDADVQDQVHVHGYDLYSPVAPGRPAVIEFAAAVPGSFDVELERSRLGVIEIQVS